MSNANMSRVLRSRDSSNESGATDAVGLSLNMTEMEDPEVKGKKKRGRPGKQPVVRVCLCVRMFC